MISASVSPSRTRKFGPRPCRLAPLLFLLPAGGYAQHPPPGRAEVIQQLQRGDNAQAVALASEALKAAPADCTLLSLRGIAQGGLGQTEPALASFREALTHCPTYLPALEGAAQLEFARGGAEAAPLLQRILSERPDDPTANSMLATLLRSQGSCADALPHFRSGAALFVNSPALQQGYAACLADTGDLNTALDQYQQLLAARPNDTVRYDVALLQWKLRRPDDALATLAPLLKGVSGVPALALASRIHEEKGETPEAVNLLRQAIVSSPEEVDNYLDFASIAFAHKSFQVGIDMLDAGLKRLPNAASLYVARGVLEVQLSRSDVAIADFEQAHRLDPKLSFAEDALGIMQSQQHQNGNSLALFEKQAKEHPSDPFLKYLLAEQLAQGSSDDTNDRLRAAIDAAKGAAALDPSYVAAHDLLAVLYLRSRQPELAIQQAELALALDPNDETALYQEILARRRSGDTAQIQALTTRLNAARTENGHRQQNTDRYRLQDEGNH